MSEKVLNNEMKNSSVLFPTSSKRKDTLINLYTKENSTSPSNSVSIKEEKSKELNIIQNEEELSEKVNYKIPSPLSSESNVLTETMNFFEDQKKKVNSDVEAKDIIEGLDEFAYIMSSPITPRSNTSGFSNKTMSSHSSSFNNLKSVNNFSQTINNNNNKTIKADTLIKTTTNFSNNKPIQKSDFGNDEISYAVENSSTLVAVSFEEEFPLSVDIKRQSYCSVSSDPNNRISISSISNNDKSQPLYSSSYDNNNNNNPKINLPNLLDFPKIIVQESNSTISNNQNNSINTNIENTKIKTNSVVKNIPYLRQVENNEVKEEKGLYDRSLLRQVENRQIKETKITKNDKGLYDRSFLQEENKDDKAPDYLINSKASFKLKSKGITIDTGRKSITTNDNNNNLRSFSRGRPVQPIRGNIFERRSHSQGSIGSSPIFREMNSPTDFRKFERRRNRTSDSITSSPISDNKSISIISNKTSNTTESSTIEPLNSFSLKSKINNLRSTDNNLRRANSIGSLQVSSSTSISETRPSLKSSNSMILNSNIRLESTKLNPLVNSDEVGYTPQKVIDNLNKLNIESNKTTVSDIPRIIVSMAEFVGVILVDKTNQLLNYFEVRYPKLHTVISILQVIARYIPTIIIKAFEIFNQGCRMMMARIKQVRDYCYVNNIPFPDINLVLQIFYFLKNQIIEKVMLIKKGRPSISTNKIKTIKISGPVGGHPMCAENSQKFDFGKKVEEPLSSTTSITLIQDGQEENNKINELETLSMNQKKYNIVKDNYEKIPNNGLSDDVTLVGGNRNSYVSSDSSFISDGSRTFIYHGNNNRLGIEVGSIGRNRHQHQNSMTSNGSINEPIIKENARVNNLIELFEKQMNQAKIPRKSTDDKSNGETVTLPTQPPQINPRTHSLKYSVEHKHQKTSSMASDDIVSITSTSDSSEYDKVDFEDNFNSPKIVKLNYTNGHRRSHSQPDENYLNDKEERENEVSLSQKISSEIRHHHFNKTEKINDIIDIRKNPIINSTPEKISSPIPIGKNPNVNMTPEQSLIFKRERIVEEIFQTEKTYVKELASIVHLYLDPLETVPGQFLDMQEYKTLFGNLRDIFDFHNEAFAPRLEKSCFPDRNKSIVPPPSVGSFFQLNAPVLANLYGEYYTNSNMANNFLTRIQNSKTSRFSTSLVNNKPKEAIFKKENKKRLKKFKTFLQWVCGQPEHTQMSLQGYLLLPVQRLPRYLLLLEQLLKNTLETEKEYRDLSKAKEAIRMVVEQCNERIRRFEERKKVIEVINNIRLCSSNVHTLSGKVYKYSINSHNKRLLLETVPAKTKVEFFVKLQNLTKLDDLRLIKESRFQIYKVKHCDPKVRTTNKKSKNNRREPSDFSSSPALRAQIVAAERIAQREAEKSVKKENIPGNDSRNNVASAFSPSLVSISPKIYNTVMKMSSVSTSSTVSTPLPNTIKRRRTRRRSSFESISPPYINNDPSTLEDIDVKNNDEDNKPIKPIIDTRKRSLSTTVEVEDNQVHEDPDNDDSLYSIDMKDSQDDSKKYDPLISNPLPATAIWEQVYLINNYLVEVLSSTNELVRVMELVKPKVGHLPNSILSSGCQVDVIVENGIKMLTVCDSYVTIYLMGLEKELYEWKEAIENIIQ